MKLKTKFISKLIKKNMQVLVDSLKDFFLGLESPMLQALAGGLFTWLLTAIGAGLVFCFKSTNRKVLDTCLGFTGGVMIAASFWSLLSPSIASVEIQQELGITNLPIWFAPATGFLFGALFLYFLDKKIPHLHLFERVENAEGPKSNFKKTELLVLAIALHNIPEGLAVGVAFGALAHGMDIGMEIGGAIALAIGMGIQNAPEGFAVSMPLRRQGLSKFKSWQWGQLSAIVEPIFAVIGAAIVMSVYPLLPYALAFAAGAMIFIVVEEVIPESQSGGNTDLATMGLIGGFIVMMILDVSLG